MSRVGIDISHMTGGYNPVKVPVFVCTWDGALVEIHTEATLRHQYKDTIFDHGLEEEFSCMYRMSSGYTSMKTFKINDLLEFLSEKSWYCANMRGQDFVCENMTIRRIL